MNKKELKAVEGFMMAKIDAIHKARTQTMIKSYYRPDNVLIGSVVPPTEEEKGLLYYGKDTGCTFMGMKVIIDSRVPVGEFRITTGGFKL
jgi:hypothetical protein